MMMIMSADIDRASDQIPSAHSNDIVGFPPGMQLRILQNEHVGHHFVVIKTQPRRLTRRELPLHHVNSVDFTADVHFYAFHDYRRDEHQALSDTGNARRFR